MSTDALQHASDALAAAADPDGGLDELVASLLAGIDDEEQQVRVSSAWATCIVVAATPKAVGPVAHGLAERLVMAPDETVVRRTLATVAETDETVVAEALAATVEGDVRPYVRAVREADPWDLDDVLASEGDGPSDPARRVIRTDETAEESAEAVGHVQRDEEDRSDSPDPVAEDESEASDSDADPQRKSDATRKRERIRRLAASKTFKAIQYFSEFEDMTVVTPPRERRFADVIRTRVTADGTESGVALRLFHRPNDGDRSFEARLAEHLASWAAVGDLDGVTTVLDWGDRPRPWAGTEYVEQTVARRGRRPLPQALREARALTGTLANLHGRDVIHGSIDASSVVYPETGIDGPGRPLLDDVGLLFACRTNVDLSSILDPRYAAPEHFDRKFGRIDCSTDVYQLGGVLYTLLTGQPPYRGSVDDIRERVCAASPPTPSAVRSDLPAAVDDVVAKAMAPQKLTRYETATRFHREVATLCERLQ
ncbi:hypothetical protein VB773_09190 [Haloarculaceae archaeon H-GB2-1]|nr:hypothetical protein [Haloarculaceae archaeon H-GB1-1]MEA5386221.1 hypothetical protein [Haloarculaceae archaeon H-GB11]MEA5407724.1 hypothetical protein [Haloarculaceae archaeon H-GB2-1]